jgi:hypothetical protein
MTPKQLALMEQLHPELRARMTEILERLGGRMVPLSAHRSPAEQAAIYQYGRTKITWSKDWKILAGGKPIEGQRRRTKAAPMQSAHNYSPSRAVDCVLNTSLVDVGLHEGVRDAWDTTTKQAVETWAEYGALVVAKGLIWGGGWKMRDMPHAELLDFRGKQWD